MDSARPVGLTGAPIRAREVASLAWPAIVQGLLHTIVFLADRLMVGRYDADALASMQISGPLLWSVFSIVGAFAAGTVAVVGRSVGARDPHRARAAAGAVLGMALVLGAIIAVAGVALRHEAATLLAGGPATSETVRALSATYQAFLFPSAPLYLLGFMGTTVLQASGDTRTPLRIAVITELLNVTGNWLLIYGHLGAPEMGIAGAGLASSLAFSFNGLAIFMVLRRNRGPVRVDLRPTPAWREALRAVLRVSQAAFVEKLIYHGGFLVFVALIGRLGDVAMAANQSLIALESMGFIAAAGFGVAAGALVSQQLGAGRPDQAERAGWLATGLGIAALSLVSALFLVFPERLVSLFTQDPAIVSLGARCLRIAAVAQPLMAISDALASALRGAGDTRNPMVAALVGPVAVRLTATWYFAFHLELGLLGVWLGSTADWAVRAVWLAVVFRRGRWRSLEV